MNTGRNCNGKRRSTCVALAAALASVVAVLGGAGRGSAQPLTARKAEAKKVDPVEIRKALLAKLSRDARFSTVTTVTVDPVNGTVTLSGRVATEADRDAVGKLTSSVPGVSMIYNEIQPEKPER
jgi:osmotically-inducible protein OsmY